MRECCAQTRRILFYANHRQQWMGWVLLLLIVGHVWRWRSEIQLLGERRQRALNYEAISNGSKKYMAYVYCGYLRSFQGDNHGFETNGGEDQGDASSE